MCTFHPGNFNSVVQVQCSHAETVRTTAKPQAAFSGSSSMFHRDHKEYSKTSKGLNGALRPQAETMLRTIRDGEPRTATSTFTDTALELWFSGPIVILISPLTIVILISPINIFTRASALVTTRSADMVQLDMRSPDTR